MNILTRNFAVIAAAIVLFSVTLVSTQQVRFSNASTACVGYQGEVNTIMITCDVSFLDVVQAINDPGILEQEAEQNGQYILNANMQVDDGITFEMTSNGDNLQYLKLAGENGIIVYGKILIDGVTITSWDVSEGDIIQQDMNGSVSRGYIQFAGSECSQNLEYALDPHTGTHDMNITNNYLHHNRYGAICSEDCYNILIEGNTAHHNTDAGIVFSRNMTNSIARNNHIYNATSGISVSESPNNQIYNNTIESATDEGILLFNPEVVDDGSTEGNIAYDNVISSSEDGIRATNSHDNILENNTFDDIESSEYLLSLYSNILIRGQNFDDVLIAVGDPATENLVEIVDSGIIEVTEEANDDDEEEDGNEDDEEEEENEANTYNTDIERYSKILSD